jgi:hypothetical protein
MSSTAVNALLASNSGNIVQAAMEAEDRLANLRLNK